MYETINELKRDLTPTAQKKPKQSSLQAVTIKNKPENLSSSIIHSYKNDFLNHNSTIVSFLTEQQHYNKSPAVLRMQQKETPRETFVNSPNGFAVALF
mmetsp:Transcript_29603/g.41975  ORF Transcript_29603/g.41975 Transcript_29603/m.41975 type:complete len:98 (+) Transcript_29603:80-373(+)